MAPSMSHDCIIIGGGPAGLSAAVYAARAQLHPLIIEGEASSAGGQLMLTTHVENYPGFSSILGPDLIKNLRDHATKFGTKFVTEDVVSVDFSQRPFTLHTASGNVYSAKTVIIATGARVRMLGLESERQLLGKGVSTCATCDAFFYKNKEVIIIGGGDTAMEEALVLAKFASHIYVVHRRDTLRASKIMQERVKKNEKISFMWNTEVLDIYDPAVGKVTGVSLRNLQTQKVTQKKIDGVFLAIGHIPNTDLFTEELDVDPHGYIVTQGVTTSVPGVFACGDVQDPVYKQAITSAGTGCMAALDAERFLERS